MAYNLNPDQIDEESLIEKGFRLLSAVAVVD